MSHRGLIAVPLLVLACIGGCSRHGSDAVLKLALQTEPSTLDPAYSSDFASGRVSSLIHSNLVAFDPDGKVIPDLAARWEVSADARSYIFHLREAHFSNGRRVVAGDVVYSLLRLLDPATASPRWWLLSAVRGASAFHEGAGPHGRVALEAPDDSTVSVALEEPLAHFASLLAMPAAGVVCREEVERLGAQYGRTPCGSGPWKLEAWREGDEIDLVPNPGAPGPAPSIAGISIRIIPEPMTQIAEFETGNLDVLEVPRAELEHWRTAGITLLSREELRVAYIGLNTRKPPFNDVRVRRAVNLAVDVDKIIARVLFGGAARARGVVPPALRGSAEPADLYPYDPARARALLAEAGHPDGIDIEIWQRENPEGGRVLESVQGYLAAVGVRAKLVTREWSAFKEAVDKGTPDAFYLDWYADYPDAENFLVPLFHSSNIGGKGNRTGYSNARVDSLLDAAGRTTDAGRRWELYRRAEEIVYRDAPWLFLWFPVQYEVCSPRLEGYRIPVIFNGQRYTDVRLQ
jgi:ABC-type transport system substrate-binding protein